MDHKKLGEKLRRRRDSFGYSQIYLGAKIGVDQSTISLLEKGELKFTDAMIQNIKAVPEFEDFDQDPPEQEVEVVVPQTIVKRWRWGKPLLYLMIGGVSLFLGDQVVRAVDDLARGITDGGGLNTEIRFGAIVISLIMLALLIRWVFWKAKL